MGQALVVEQMPIGGIDPASAKPLLGGGPQVRRIDLISRIASFPSLVQDRAMQRPRPKDAKSQIVLSAKTACSNHHEFLRPCECVTHKMGSPMADCAVIFPIRRWNFVLAQITANNLNKGMRALWEPALDSRCGTDA